MLGLCDVFDKNYFAKPHNIFSRNKQQAEFQFHLITLYLPRVGAEINGYFQF